MPELPEVENYKKYFLKTSLNKKIENINSIGRKTLSNISSAELNEKIKGKAFQDCERHGKYLFVQVQKDLCMFMHFGMTGYLVFSETNTEISNSVRAKFDFKDGSHLLFNDRRMFGRIGLTTNKDQFISEHKLGKDPINDKLNFKEFLNLVGDKSGAAKTVLMDQEILAGIGNVYSDEILFHAGVHPEAQFINLNDDKLKEVYSIMIKILKSSIKYVEKDDNFPENYLVNKRKKGAECPLCNGEIKMKTIGGRSAYFCNKHQKMKA